MENKKSTSVVIPVYNEEKSIAECLKSLKTQSYKPIEIIIVDDGSQDDTLKIIRNLKLEIRNLFLLKQKHLGPGKARNLGAANAKGEILVFADADMTFDKNFIKDLVKPILEGKTIGTFSKNEMVKNKDNIWSNCWNINKNLPKDRMIAKNYPNKAPVFRAILKSDFKKVGGFDESGEYTDDWSLSKKLGEKSTAASGAIYYHSNPESLKEVWQQARWIGKNEFITGSFLRKLRSLVFYSFPASFVVGLFKSLINFNFYFLFFKLIYDLAVFTSVTRSFFGETKAK